MAFRRIKPNHGCELPSAFIAVDCETIPDPDAADSFEGPQVHKLRLGVALAWRRVGDKWTKFTECVFRSGAEWLSFAESYARFRQPLVIYAHNWQFDAQALGVWQMIDAGLLKASLPPKKVDPEFVGPTKPPRPYKGVFAIDDYPFWMTLFSKRGTFRFIDSLNYYRVGLAELGEAVGLSKGAMPDFDEPDNVWIPYCRRDAEIVAVAMQRLMAEWRKQDLGNWQPTAAALAYSSYRHKFMPQPIVTHDRLDVKKFERAAFVGGESHNWFRGDYPHRVHQVDVRGMYPSIMRNELMPVQLSDYVTGPNSKHLLERRPDYVYAASVTVGDCVGDVPLKIDRRVTYPHGVVDCHLCGPELDRVLAAGRILRVHAAARYTAAKLFTGWVDYWTEKRAEARQTGNGTADGLAKLMLNSLFGKFGQLPQNWVLWPARHPEVRFGLWAAPSPVSGRLVKWRAIGGNSEYRNETQERQDSHTVLPAIVTAHGRELMRSIVATLPRHSALLQQVDSLVVTDDGLESLKNSVYWGNGEPGKMRLVWSADSIWVGSAQHYRTPDAEVYCGVPTNRERIGNSQYQYTQFSTTIDVIVNGPTAGPIKKTVTIVAEDRPSDVFYDVDGWESSPCGDKSFLITDGATDGQSFGLEGIQFLRTPNTLFDV